MALTGSAVRAIGMPSSAGLGAPPARWHSVGVTSEVIRRLSTPERYHFGASLRSILAPRHDPCGTLAGDDFWLAVRTPDGPATLHLARAAGELVATGHGPGGA